MKYPYTARDLFEKPEKYEYAQCAKDEFLTAWKDQREQYMKGLSSGAAESLLSEIKTNRTASGGVIHLEDLLQALQRSEVPEGLGFDTAKAVMDSLVTKFEIFRRLFATYDATLRKTADAANATNGQYIEFGISLAKFAHKRAKYLSTLLKLTDALTSRPGDTYTWREQARLRGLLCEERTLVGAWESRIA